MAAGGVSHLTSSPDEVKEGLTWSTDSRQVIFSSAQAVTAVDVESREARTLVRYTGEGSHIHLSADPWSPGGRYLGFQIAGGHGVCD